MTPSLRFFCALCVALLWGCQQQSPPQASPEPADPREAEVLSAPEYLALPRFANADLQRGERLFLQCTVCHTLGRDQNHRPNGPNLWGMFGRQVASSEGYAYSPALRNFDGTWTPATVDEWLTRPAGYIPGNAMPFAGIRNRDERTDLIAYLLRETARELGD